MKYNLTGIFLFLSVIITLPTTLGQSVDKNYIKTTVLLVKELDPSNISNLEIGEKLETIQYFDGLGRLIQTNFPQITPDSKDLVQHIEYDNVGRQKFDYLPFPHQASSGYVQNCKNETLTFYNDQGNNPIAETTVPFGEKAYDGSPLNRVMKQGSPGESWQVDQHPQEFDYRSNIISDDILIFELSSDGQFSSVQSYDTNELFVYETQDENGNISTTYKNKSGKTIVKESELSPSEKVRTYYIYDLYDNLAVVISPGGSNQLNSSFSSTQDFIYKWCFTYKYDSRNRPVEKTISGMKEPVYMVYDSLDRVVLTRDGNMERELQWYYSKYDVFGRTIQEGIYTNMQIPTREGMQSHVDDYISQHSFYETVTGENFDIQHGYTNNAFPPIEDCEVLKVHYFDGYDFDNDETDDYSYYPVFSFGDLDPVNNQKGLLTASKVKMPDDIPRGSSCWLMTVSFYDHKSRIIQTQANNHLEGGDTITTEYTFAGDVIKTLLSHTGEEGTQTVLDSIVYDHARRLKESYIKINDQSEILQASFTYNEIGELVEKNLHNTGTSEFLQSIDYAYNIRGWLNGINTRDNGNDARDAFFQELLYDDEISELECEPQYNGNISAINWAADGSAVKGYGYSYDALNRLTKAVYGELSGGTWSVSNHYSTPILQYDYNGNIQRLQRNGLYGSNYGTLDDLYYFYAGNRIIGVNDDVSSNYGFMDNGYYFDINDPTTTEYFYDDNGNMTTDLNKGIITIEYNHLNLPIKIEFENKRRIHYFYDANGVKLRKTYYEDNLLVERTDYSGGFVYKDDHIDYFLTSEGRMKYDESESIYHAEYFLKDHLGNVRVVLSTDPERLLIAQITDYYPFGGEIPISGTDDNQIKYNSKELQTEAGLGWYDYRYRFYDPQLGRFVSIDPLAEKYTYNSTYAFAENKLGLGNEIEGLELGPTWHTYQQAAATSGMTTQKYIDIQMKGSYEVAKKTVSYTDVNDATIIGTWITRGKDAINIDNSKASAVDKGFAIAGALIPFVSGSATKGVFKGLGELFGISKKVDNIGNPFKGKSLKQVQKGFDSQVKKGKLEHKFTDPISGSKSYKNTESGYSYNVDSGINSKTGIKNENAHVDVNYPNPKPKHVPKKRKWDIEF